MSNAPSSTVHEPSEEQVSEFMKGQGMSPGGENREIAAAKLRDKNSCEAAKIRKGAPILNGEVAKARQRAAEAAEQAEALEAEALARIGVFRAHIVEYARLRLKARRVRGISHSPEQTEALANQALAAFLDGFDLPSPNQKSQLAASIELLQRSAILAPHVDRFAAEMDKRAEVLRNRIRADAEAERVDLHGIVELLRADWTAAPANFGSGFDIRLLDEVLR